MSDTYTKLFRGITTSTIVDEPLATRWLWITLLASCDRRGIVYGSVPGLARLANVTISECEDGLRRLQSADPWSRSKEHEGRRIEAIDGGWVILNHGKYDAMRSAEQARERKREWDREYRPSGHARGKSKSDDSPTKSDDSPRQSAKVRSPPTPSPSLEKQEQDQEHLRGAIADAITPALEAIVLTMPTVNGTEHGVTQASIDTWSDAYPGISVVAELRKARAWLLSNPRRGKTARGMARFCNSWLERAQNDAGRLSGRTGPPAPTRSKVAQAYGAIGQAIEEMRNGSAGGVVSGVDRGGRPELSSPGFGGAAGNGNDAAPDPDMD